MPFTPAALWEAEPCREAYKKSKQTHSAHGWCEQRATHRRLLLLPPPAVQPLSASQQTAHLCHRQLLGQLLHLPLRPLQLLLRLDARLLRQQQVRSCTCRVGGQWCAEWRRHAAHNKQQADSAVQCSAGSCKQSLPDTSLPSTNTTLTRTGLRAGGGLTYWAFAFSTASDQARSTRAPRLRMNSRRASDSAAALRAASSSGWVARAFCSWAASWVASRWARSRASCRLRCRTCSVLASCGEEHVGTSGEEQVETVGSRQGGNTN
jgi:hypothetical protein